MRQGKNALPHNGRCLFEVERLSVQFRTPLRATRVTVVISDYTQNPVFSRALRCPRVPGRPTSPTSGGKPRRRKR